ncbi:MAG: Ig-like domain-containing protein [Chloroflexi bacterium]|nr:Ig-like domain-containing protein [Chloroflexota bacterium]MCI0579402.1 Ig-like domain-containing protein [Chloroflexota bacterium]MCI0643772.1 Ig-like domain-containing protein [Chloroflexota bacterium]MCI0726585.1 Ig-like domain-containing protein [Chloroflexota bacterium]
MLNFKRVFAVLVLLAIGLWLVFSGSGPAPESASRQMAMQAFAPAPGTGDQDAAPAESGIAAPVVVNLADVPPGVYDPNNQYDRWQRGEIDLDEHESIVSEAELAAMKEAALHLPPGNVQRTEASLLTSLTGGANWASLDYTECCGGGGNVPPDPELAVGPNHVIAVVNVAFEIYDKNGASLAGPTTFQSFMGSNPNCTGVFDPNALYDEQSDRYVLGIDADGTHYCIAVSQTGNPTGAWNIYAFQTGSSTNFFDYPHAGVGNAAIYMGGNIFQCNIVSCTFKEARVWAFDKAAMYAGSPAAFVSRALAVSEDTPQPLNLHGWNQGTWPASGPHYFFTETNYNGANYSVFSWNDPFGANTFATVGTVNLVTATGVTAGMPVDVPQSGSTSKVQANDFRPQDFEYRNGFAWSVQTIACNPGGGTVDCIRWAQINPTTATVVQAGVFASNGEYRFFGDLAVNQCDDMAVGYSKSSTSIFPSVWYTGRESGDPAGTLQAEAQLKAGEIVYTAFDSSPRRWGDYTEMTIAPDGVTFWYLGEYSKNTGTTQGRWGTYIGSFSFPSCGGGPTPTPTPIPPTPTPAPSSTMHVGDLDGAGTPSGRRWNATVTITVHDQNDNPVAGATVTGNWSNGASGSSTCTTNSNGQCSVTKTNIQQNKPSVRFTVTNVTKSSYTYNPAGNHDPDGDSNGTFIVVNRP